MSKGIILLKNAPSHIKKEAPMSLKRGDKIELKLGFQAATTEELQKLLGDNIPEGYIAGWASTPTRDHYNHEVVTGAFQDAMNDRGLSGPKGIKLLLDHDWKKPAGTIKTLEYRRGSLWMEAQMNLEVGYAKERWQMLKMMGGANFSVGFMLQDYDIMTKEEDGDEDWYLRINRGDLFEISIVMFPGNEDAQMTFVKARLDEDNPDSDVLLFANMKPAAWKMGASKNLPLADGDAWDGAAVKARLFRACGFDTDKPDLEMARKVFLAYDASNPDVRSAYRLPFCDVVDGKITALSSGIQAAASFVANADLPDSVKTSAKSVIDHYREQAVEMARESKEAPKTQAEFEKALVALGLVTSRNAAREIARVAKTCPQLFIKKVEEIRPVEPALDAGRLTEVLSLIQKAKTLLPSAAS